MNSYVGQAEMKAATELVQAWVAHVLAENERQALSVFARRELITRIASELLKAKTHAGEVDKV